jgi:hypothetical protein
MKDTPKMTVFPRLRIVIDADYYQTRLACSVSGCGALVTSALKVEVGPPYGDISTKLVCDTHRSVARSNLWRFLRIAAETEDRAKVNADRQRRIA